MQGLCFVQKYKVELTAFLKLGLQSNSEFEVRDLWFPGYFFSLKMG